MAPTFCRVAVAVLVATAEMTSVPVSAEELTTGRAVFCREPGQLEEAYRAAGDRAWFAKLDCIVARAGLEVVELDRTTLHRKVRLRGRGEVSEPLWTYPEAR